MKKTIAYTVALAVVGSTAPGISLLIGNSYFDKLASNSSTDTSKDWRYAKLAYRVAQFSPFFNSTAQKKAEDVDQILSATMYKLVLTGANQNNKRNQPIGPKQHLSFLSSRTDNDTNLAKKLAKAHIRYGRSDELQDALQDTNTDSETTPYEIAAALLSGDQEYLETFAKNQEYFPTGLYFFTDQNPLHTDTPLAQLITAYKSPETADWMTIYADVEAAYKPLIAEGYARTGEAQTEVLQTMLQDATDEWVCAKLAAARTLKDSNLVTEAVEQLKTQQLLYTYTQLGTSAYCHPDVFSEAKTAVQEEATWLTLFAAHAYLAQFKMKKAQDLLYTVQPPTEQERQQSSQIEVPQNSASGIPQPSAPESVPGQPGQQPGQPGQQPGQFGQQPGQPGQQPGQPFQPNPAPAPTPRELTNTAETPNEPAPSKMTKQQQVFHLYLHCLLNEMEGNTNKMEYYAEKGLPMDKSVFSLILGKAHLLRTQKQGAEADLAESKADELPENLKALHADLTAIVLRTKSDRESTEINNKKVLFNVWENNAEFREWYTMHTADVLQDPTASTVVLSTLVNSSRVQQEGEVLTDFFWCNRVDPYNVAMYSHVKYMYFSLQPTPKLTDKKEAFINARTWISNLPFPQLLRIALPEFSVKLEQES